MTTRSSEVVSGHESFPCRYGWLPKLYDAVTEDESVFAVDEQAMVRLGLGKNMVRSIRFWGDAFGLTQASGRSVTLTTFAHRLLHPSSGRDPYLADTASLWRLHWVVATAANLTAWNVAFSSIRDTQVSRRRLTDLVRQRAEQIRSTVTTTTVTQHIDVFLRTYDCARATEAVLEESLGSPLQELGLLSVTDSAMIEFHRGEKRDLDVATVAFALASFWKAEAAQSRTVSLRAIMFHERGLGTIFRLDETSLHVLLSTLCADSGAFEHREDGAGGIDIVSLVEDPILALEALAWQ